LPVLDENLKEQFSKERPCPYLVSSKLNKKKHLELILET
jgi:hypothetical protein